MAAAGGFGNLRGGTLREASRRKRRKSGTRPMDSRPGSPWTNDGSTITVAASSLARLRDQHGVLCGGALGELAAVRRAVRAATAQTHQARPAPEVRVSRGHERQVHRVRHATPLAPGSAGGSPRPRASCIGGMPPGAEPGANGQHTSALRARCARQTGTTFGVIRRFASPLSPCQQTAGAPASDTLRAPGRNRAPL